MLMPGALLREAGAYVQRALQLVMVLGKEGGPAVQGGRERALKSDWGACNRTREHSKVKTHSSACSPSLNLLLLRLGLSECWKACTGSTLDFFQSGVYGERRSATVRKARQSPFTGCALHPTPCISNLT
jgi:hypothetical protein